MARIRNFLADDVPAVAHLWLKVFRGQDIPAPPSLCLYFQEIFLNQRWTHAKTPSLLCEEDDGTVVGFLGVLPCPMTFKGQTISAAVSSQFMVDTKRHRGMAGIELMRRFLAGPQELSFTDGASNGARRLWEAASGEIVTLYGCIWTRVLRPTAHLLNLMKTKKSFRPVASVCAPAASVFDSAVSRIAFNPYAVGQPGVVGQDVSAEALSQYIAELPSQWLLKPNDDLHSIQWRLQEAERATTRGRLHRIVVLNAQNERLGWYVYYARQGGVSKVLQLGGKEREIARVIEHLLYHASREGATAVSGRLEPRFARELSRLRCTFSFPDVSVLAHSRNRDILSAIQAGNAFLTRLDGEWWMRFQEEAWI